MMNKWIVLEDHNGPVLINAEEIILVYAEPRAADYTNNLDDTTAIVLKTSEEDHDIFYVKTSVMEVLTKILNLKL